MTIDPNIRIILIDSFCGAGGVTEGFHRAKDEFGNKVCKVIIGINHDAKAIESHAANHPDTIHFVEDFTTLDPNKLISIVAAARLKYPNAKVLFWASAECTHHSKAKGGLPRDADSRSLPEHIERYVKVLNPDIIGVENVVEFLDWGPINEFGKPIKELKGTYYKEWRDKLISHGYEYDYRKLNAADYGAYTSRLRYFGIFAKETQYIAFPQPTHSKKGGNGLEKWNSVKDVLMLDEEGDSIFDRKKPLVDATLERIIAGIVQFVIGGTNDFMIKYNSMSQSKKYKAPGIDEPCPTVSCQHRIGVVKAKFMQVSYSGAPWNKNFGIDRPAHTVTTVDHHHMLTAYYGNGYNTSINEPCGTITTKDRFALITSKFIDQQYGNSKPTGINKPIGALTANPKFNLINAKWLMDTQFGNVGKSLDNPCPTITANRKHFYLMNPQFSNKGGSIDKPCFTLIARMDKMPPYLVVTETGSVKIKINESDTDTMKKLKTLCNDYGIIDVKMRMLFITELLRIQGFGDNYKLKGTKAEMKKFIGNAVECTQSEALATSLSNSIIIQSLKEEI